MSSRKFVDLSIEAQASFADFEEQLRGAGIDFVRACTYRSAEEQAALYAKGRTKPGLVVTWAEAGQSRHNETQGGRPASTAADYYPLIHGKLCGDQTDEELHLWLRMGTIAKNCALEWGGDWSGVKTDRPHFQLPKPRPSY